MVKQLGTCKLYHTITMNLLLMVDLVSMVPKAAVVVVMLKSTSPRLSLSSQQNWWMTPISLSKFVCYLIDAQLLQQLGKLHKG